MKPPPLRSGDTIGVVSPSWGGAGLFPHRIEQGMRYAQSLGYRVKLAPHALNNLGYVSDTAENRAADIHTMFADPSVRAIIAAIGGDHACHLLPLLDFDLIRRNPKIFMGYSDITVLNVAIWQKSGLTTFNGPAFMTDFGEYPQMLEYTEKSLLKTITRPEPAGDLYPAEAWTEETPAWERRADQEKPRTLQRSNGWTWLKPGNSAGRLIGGCIESLQHLRGTPFWPDWEDTVLFWETSEEKPSPESVDGILMDYENMGVFEKLSGMLVGRPMKYDEVEKRELRERILERTAKYDFPVLTDLDFGHTSPQLTFPIGCRISIDSNARKLRLIEAAVN